MNSFFTWKDLVSFTWYEYSGINNFLYVDGWTTSPVCHARSKGAKKVNFFVVSLNLSLKPDLVPKKFVILEKIFNERFVSLKNWFYLLQNWIRSKLILHRCKWNTQNLINDVNNTVGDANVGGYYCSIHTSTFNSNRLISSKIEEEIFSRWYCCNLWNNKNTME